VVPFGFAAARFAPSAWASQFLLPRPLVKQSVEQVFGNPANVRGELVDRFFEITLREGNRRAIGLRVQALLAERGQPLYTEAWARVKQPTLLIWGERDRLIPPATAQQYLDLRAKDAPPAELKILPGLGHVPQLEDAKTSLAAARPFIDAVK
jgi:pimeloyl-ACP methyl ester carboxylesterase